MSVLLVATTLAVYFVLPAALGSLPRGRRTSALACLVGAAVIAWIVTAVVHLQGGDPGGAGSIAMLLTDGVAIGVVLLMIATPSARFGTRVGVTAGVLAAMTGQWAWACGLQNSLVHDIPIRGLYRALSATGLPMETAVVDVGVRWLLPSLSLVASHFVAVAAFFAWIGAWLLLQALYVALPRAFDPPEPPTSPRALAGLTLPGRGVIAIATVLAVILGIWWPPAALGADLLLGTFAASGVVLVIRLGRMTPGLRPVAQLYLLACAVWFPLAITLAIGGLAAHISGLDRRLPPPASATSAVPFQGPRRLRFYVLGVVGYLGFFAIQHPAIAVGPTGPVDVGLTPLSERVDATEFVAEAGQILLAHDRGPFWMDEFEYPPDPREPPARGVTWAEAETLCSAAGKRLCSAREWTWACADLEALSDDPVLAPATACASPSGGGTTRLRDCRSRSGVSALLGGVWEWTDIQVGGFHVLRGSPEGPSDEIRFTCGYEFLVHEVNERELDLSKVGFRCCRDAVRQGE